MNDDVRYNEIRQKSVHNSFQRSEGIADQFLYWRIRSMEIDVHHKDPLRNEIRGGDWSVHHDWYDPLSAVSRLSQFLDIMRGLNRLNPDHEVCTLFIDIKDPFPANPRGRHGAVAFDALLKKHLGSTLYTPRRLANRARGAKTLRESIERRGWPTLGELRGKFIVVLTGSPTQLEHYAANDDVALDRLAFVSCPVDARAHIPGKGDQIFFNVNGEEKGAFVGPICDTGYVCRAYYLNSWEHWRAAASAGCHHLATDMVNERVDPWASTRNDEGFPFRRIDGRELDGNEHGAVTGIWARTDDIWDTQDSCMFQYRRMTASTIEVTYDYAIVGPNSHTDDWVKGAVMARAGLEPDAAYFGVFRVGEKHGLRVQYRRRAGGPTTNMSTEIGPGGMFGRDVDQDTIAHVRLEISDGGRTATAWGSYDRPTSQRRWTLLGSMTFEGHRGDKPLRYHGLAVSAHGQRRGAKFLFVPAAGSAAPGFPESALISGDADHAGWVDESSTGRWLTSEFSTWKPPRTRSRPRSSRTRAM